MINDVAWILEGMNYRLCHTVLSLQNVKVAHLIYEHNRKWKKEFIFNTFSSEDAQWILNIPLSTVEIEDWMV